MMAKKRSVLLFGFLCFLLAGGPVAGQQETPVSYHMIFRGYSVDTLRGVEEYLVQFPFYAGHRLIQEGPEGNEYEYQSAATEREIAASLRRMFLFLDIEGAIDIEAQLIAVERPGYVEPSLPKEKSLAPAQESEPRPVSLSLRLTTSRGDIPSFTIGENFDLTVELSRDAWLYCFYRQADGTVVKFFPNPQNKEARLKGGTAHRIPGDIYPFEMPFAEPPGNELLTCYAADRDIKTDLPALLRTADFAALPPGMETRLQEIFDGLANADVVRDSLPIAVKR